MNRVLNFLARPWAIFYYGHSYASFSLPAWLIVAVAVALALLLGASWGTIAAPLG